MSKTKLISTILLVLGLAAWCLYLNRDSFASQPIQISHRVSPWLRGPQARQLGPMDKASPVVFSFDKFYKFTEIQVFYAADLATNKYAHPLWHLVTKSNSFPTASLTYGQWLRGMAPNVQGARPDPLEPGVTYTLVVKTVQDKTAKHDFTTAPRN